MKRCLLMVAVCVFGWLAHAEKRSSFVPGAVWPDTEGVHINAHGGGFLFHDGMYYWFGEHKIAGPKGNSAQVGVRCYSSADLYNWKNEGVALAVSDDPDSDMAKGCILERPKVVYNRATRQFVMWFHLELKGEGYSSARSGVAVSDRVTGPYRFVESFRPNGAMARDQTLFVDDDGAAYHLYASENNATLHISRLTDDYLKPSGDYRRLFEKRSMEAPAICKRDGKYYFLGSGCTGWRPNAARSAVASHIFGPWEELGNPCAGTNPGLGVGPEKTFGGQSTYLLPVQGKPGAVVAVFDVWTPKNPIDGTYLFLPVAFENGGFEIQWRDEWSLDDL
ncbi:glycoside hydrolase family 43 protein [Pontiella sp.]|uniref:glycoside hydrolase family 43 protein n=1 Tax=Pontiella sp. TaxID=2837462 RepID=UPI003567B7F1